MNIRVGTAPDSWGVWFPQDDRQIPWERYLDEVAEAGYGWTELGPYGYLPTDVNILRKELSRRGLGVPANFAMGSLENPSQWTSLERQVIGTCESLSLLGGKYLVLIDDVYTDLFTGAPVDVPSLDADAWKRLIDTTHRIAGIAARFGLKVTFHPHAETHVEYEDQIERFLCDTDPTQVSICLDTGHHAYRGGDPVAFLLRHADRVAYLHLKSVNGETQRKVQKENIPFAKAVAMDLFCELSEGSIDMLALRDALETVGYEGWVTVEQDMYPAQFDKPLPIAKRTRNYLREIGIG